MQPRQRESLLDTLLIWGFVLSFVGLMGAGFFEACKIFSALPAAFESSPAALRNPMRASDDDARPNLYGRGRMTPGERARERERAGQQDH
jgi:hypothetical protein